MVFASALSVNKLDLTITVHPVCHNQLQQYASHQQRVSGCIFRQALDLAFTACLPEPAAAVCLAPAPSVRMYICMVWSVSKIIGYSQVD